MKSLALLSISLVSTVACSSSNDHTATQNEYDDVAQQMASTAAPGSGGGEVGSMSDSLTLALGGSLPGFALGGSGMITGTHGGLTYSYGITCKDVSGATMPFCTKLTNSADIDLMWSGTLALPNFTASLTRDGSWSIKGLQTSQATISGSGSFTFDASVTSVFRSSTSSYHLSYDATYDAVLIDTATKLAVGCDVMYSIDGQHTVGGATSEFSIDADLAFHADGTATLTLDGSHEYTLDLATGLVVKVK